MVVLILVSATYKSLQGKTLALVNRYALWVFFINFQVVAIFSLPLFDSRFDFWMLFMAIYDIMFPNYTNIMYLVP